MEQAAFTHYRDHKNGGKFDGTCYAQDSAFSLTSPANAIRFRIYFDSFTGDKYLWCIGTSSGSEYYVKLKDDTGSYHPEVTYLNQTYDFDEIEMESGRHYNLSLSQVTSTSFKIELREQYDQYIDTQTVTTSTIVSGSLGTSLRVGGHPRFTSDNFVGIVYDWETYLSSTSDRTRFVFYQNYDNGGGAAGDDTVPNFWNAKNDLTITSRPSDFWSSGVNIGKYFAQGKPVGLNIDTNVTNDIIIPKFTFTLFNYSDIKKGDTIKISTSDPAVGYFIVDEVATIDTNYTKVTAYDFWHLLKDMNIARSILYSTSNNVFTHIYWSNYTPDSSDYSLSSPLTEDDYVTWDFVVRMMFYHLQMDNLIPSGVAFSLSTTYTKYYDYQHSAYVKYEDIIFCWYMLFYSAKDSNGGYDDEATLDIVFKFIMSALRLKYNYGDYDVMFVNSETAGFTFDDDETYLKLDETINETRFFQVTVKGIQDGTTDTVDRSAYLSTFDSDDYYEFIGEDEELTNYNNYGKVTTELEPNLWLFFVYSGSLTHFYDSTYKKNFPIQYAKILQDELKIKAVWNTRIIENSAIYSYISQRFKYAHCDFARRFMEIKQKEG